MPYIGTAVIGLIVISAGVKLVCPSGIRGLIAHILVKYYPGSIAELLRRRRLSFWYKTSRSPHKQRIWAYADRHSIRPGEAFRLMMSAGPDLAALTGHVEIFRIGYYEHGDRQKVWQSDSFEVKEHGLNNTAAALGPAWPAAVKVGRTARWRTGYHSVDFIEADGTRHRDVAFIVVTSAQRKADVLIKLATATYQAYNRWGGHNFYLYESPDTLKGRPLGPFESDIPLNRGDMVSFDRPTTSEFWDWEYYFVLWLEQLAQEEGFSYAYATNFDLVRDPALTSDCRLFISVGHDEYWTKEEFDRTHERIFRQGGNTLFLGANTAYWQVRYADVGLPQGNEGRQLICFKSESDPIRYRAGADAGLHMTTRFRENARRPETMLAGVAYQSNLPFRHQNHPRYAYRVVDTDLPFFEGTGYAAGDYVADIIGHEWDNRDPEAEYACFGEIRVPAAQRLWCERCSHIELIPSMRIKTVFAGEAVDVAGRKGKAEAVYFESKAGAKVFSSGTNRWTWGLGKSGYTRAQFQRFNRNLVLHFLEEHRRGTEAPHAVEKENTPLYADHHA